MDEQDFKQPSKDSHSITNGHNIWLLVLSLVIVTLVGVLIWQNHSINQLQDQLFKVEGDIVPRESNQKIEMEIPADWQTYHNEEYGFRFQYPSKWGQVEEKISISTPDDYRNTYFEKDYENFDEWEKVSFRKLDIDFNFNNQTCNELYAEPSGYQMDWCNLGIRIIEYNEDQPLVITDCYEGICSIKNLLDVKIEMLGNSENLKISDNFFPPSNSFHRSYKTFGPNYKFQIFTGFRSIDLLNELDTEEFDQAVELIKKSNQDEGVNKLLNDVELVISSLRFRD